MTEKPQFPENAAKPASSLPRHIAIIMDGNGRWARNRGLSRSQGHRQGVETARNVVNECRRLGIEYLTLYTFSKENWKRPKDEVSYLFKLLAHFLSREISKFEEQNIRLNVLGDISVLPKPAREVLEKVCQKTAGNKAMQINLALNYSSRDEIAMACRKMLEEGLSPEACTPEAISKRLYTAGMPDPDLMIRTSGEERISNFLLFQCAYSEFYFTTTLWPDFSIQELHEALKEFSRRERRFGSTGEES